MATFKPLVRTKRKDGFYLVYIRCLHNQKPWLVLDAYIEAYNRILENKHKARTIIDSQFEYNT